MPSAAERQLDKKLSQIFRMNGLALRPDAMQPLYACCRAAAVGGRH